MTDSAPDGALIRDQRFARIVLDAFKAAGLHTDERVKAAGGPSSTWMTGLRKAAAGVEKLRPVRNDTYDAIERAAGWPADTARRVYAGGEPPRGTAIPVGAGVDPGVLADLTDDETAKVLDYVAMLKAARKD